MLLFVGVLEQQVVGGVGDKGFFEVGEETFDQTGDEVRVLDVFQILVVAFTEFVEGFIFLVNGYTLTEYPFLTQSCWFGAEVVDE